jgi:hypothetical protein
MYFDFMKNDVSFYLYSGVIGIAAGVLPARSSRSCLTHLLRVEYPTPMALAAS